MGCTEPSSAEKPRILFIDAFDSFTNNIVGLLEQCLGAEVIVVHINDEEVSRNLPEFLSAFDAAVVGPGPGHPAIAGDVGFLSKLWKLADSQMLPILGICLGFQSLCYNYGAKVQRLSRARHGIVTKPVHIGTDIFAGIRDLQATQYHSLHAVLGSRATGDAHDVTEFPYWQPTGKCPTLLPLAWDVSDNVNGPILMSVRHTKKPFWGLQFHPESICTSEAGNQLVSNWWMFAQEWLSLSKRNRIDAESCKFSSPSQSAPLMPRGSFSGTDGINNPNRISGCCEFKGLHDGNGVNYSQVANYSNGVQNHLAQELRSNLGSKDVFLRWRKCRTNQYITPVSLLEAIGHSRDEVMLLDSQGHSMGRYSILGLVTPGQTMSVTYKVTDRTLRYGLSATQMFTGHVKSIVEVWPILQGALDMFDPRDRSRFAETLSTRQNRSGMDCFPGESPFWGGFMGYVSYEAGLETIDVELNEACAASNAPDINFAFIHRSIVIDHEKSIVYIQSLLPHDMTWIMKVGRTIDILANPIGSENHTGRPSDDTMSSFSKRDMKASHALDDRLTRAECKKPTESPYRTKVLKCQEYLISGDSYELCLTDETVVTTPHLDEWSLYKRLRQNNPAPFGAFMRLPEVVVVGSSPERFLSWTRQGLCQFRPIKGTVKKGPGMTRELAHEILSSSKERAENLMIVDLIRHDLSGVVGAANTWVSKLMVVEDYEKVYQLVSVIEGQLQPAWDHHNVEHSPRGIDVLKASLPPGSMTGAPKKRSCEILAEIEQRPRGVYSGVLGYMDVGGGGDFSVVIRTAVRDRGGAKTSSPSHGCTETDGTDNSVDINDGINKSESLRNGEIPSTNPKDIWRIGAGGAVTIQSTDIGEFLEMETKASSVLGALFVQQV